jgi:hypothetical protein
MNLLRALSLCAARNPHELRLRHGTPKGECRSRREPATEYLIDHSRYVPLPLKALRVSGSRACPFWLLRCARAQSTSAHNDSWAAFVFLALLTACSGSTAPPVSPAASHSSLVVTVEKDTSRGETRYLIARGECRLVWEIRDVEPQVILHRTDCALPLSEQAPLIEALWQALPVAQPSQLSWGRLCPDTGCAERQLSQRLALAAYRSPDWDVARGRPLRGHENEFVRRIANAAPIYPELRELFARQGYLIEVSGVEKVLVMPASQLPYYAALQAEGVSATAKLPFDAQTWFRLRPAS